ncbi:MAG: AAA family ATPase [Thermoproteus sp.]|nr:AAA family ATPase [Thermoproteus sp.]
MRVVGIAGLPGSGKSLVASLFVKRGFALYTMGDIIRSYAKAKGITPDEAAILIRLERGSRAVAAGLGVRGGDAVIDGLRSLDEVSTIEDAAGRLFLVFIAASRRTRLRRLVERGRLDDPSTLAQFAMREYRELKLGVADLLSRADYILVNENKSVEELDSEVEAIVKML